MEKEIKLDKEDIIHFIKEKYPDGDIKFIIDKLTQVMRNRKLKQLGL